MSSVMRTLLPTDQCIPYKCALSCCKNDFQCASKAEECRQLEIGDSCYENYECKSSCCIEKVCQGDSECRLKELGMLSFFAVFILSSIIILILGLYFHARQKKRRNQMRRLRAPRIREIIAEGEIMDDDHQKPQPPIHTITVGETLAELSDTKIELQKPYLTKLEPAKTASEEYDGVIWRNRANSRVFQPMNGHLNPLELSNFDPFANSRSSILRKSMDEGREFPLKSDTRHPTSDFAEDESPSNHS